MHTKLKTYKTKKSRILTWMLPYFNDKAINAITAADIRQWQGELKEAVGATGEVLSPAYMQNLVTELLEYLILQYVFIIFLLIPAGLPGIWLERREKALISGQEKNLTAL